MSEYSQRESDGDFVQLIDEDGAFTQKLPTYLKDHQFTDCGLDYNLMSVLGPQSSGKSTLLNKLFFSQFDTMDSARGRYQVTKGVCVSKAKSQDILIMDLEGTDSNERGEENAAFEKKISLFALAISEVLLVNMWMQDIGRLNASNLSLLKTVFELNLQLFQKEKSSSKTLLLFCIRDHIEAASALSILKDQLMVAIDKIWSVLIQPELYQNSKITDFFEIQFISLPHKLLQEAEFISSVEKLRQRFIDPTFEGYFFKPEYKKSVPIDGFQIYAANIWNVILHNKDLDIPTQKEMLATFRCNSIANEVFAPFEKKCEEWENDIKERKLVTDLGKLARLESDDVLANFTKQTLLYAPSVVDQKREDLLERTKQPVLSIFSAQMLLIRENAVKFYQSHMETITQGKNTVLSDFSQTVEKVKHEVYSFFESRAQASIFKGETWDYSMHKEQLSVEIDRITEDLRKHQIRILVDNQKLDLSENMRKGLSDMFQSPGKDFWIKLREFYQELCVGIDEEMPKQLAGFESPNKDTTNLFDVLKTHAAATIRQFAESYVNQQLTLRISNRYEEIFRAGSSFKSVDDIQKVHKLASAEASQLLDIFFLYRLTNSAYDNIHLRIPADSLTEQFRLPKIGSVISSVESYARSHPDEKVYDEIDDQQSIEQDFKFNLLLDENDCSRIYSDFSSRATTSLQNAQDRFLLMSSHKSIPIWVYVLLLTLGWNEIMYFLTSPFWLFMIVVFGGIFGWAYLKNWTMDYIENGSNEIIKIVLRVVVQKVESFTKSDVGQAMKQGIETVQQQIIQVSTSEPVIHHTTSEDTDVSSLTSEDLLPTPIQKGKILERNNQRSSVRFCQGVESVHMTDLQSKIEADLSK